MEQYLVYGEPTDGRVEGCIVEQRAFGDRTVVCGTFPMDLLDDLDRYEEVPGEINLGVSPESTAVERFYESFEERESLDLADVRRPDEATFDEG